MYIAITRQHLGDNYHGSASDFVKYLEKENEGKALEEQELFFNQTENDIDAQRVIAEIDANTAKLSKRDPKFYSIMVSPSQAELKHIGNDPEKLKGIVDTMVNKYIDLNAINNIVISLAFSQLFLDGRIEREIKKWAEAAFSRELMYLDFWDSEKGEMEKRQKRMNQLLSDLRKG